MSSCRRLFIDLGDAPEEYKEFARWLVSLESRSEQEQRLDREDENDDDDVLRQDYRKLYLCPIGYGVYRNGTLSAVYDSLYLRTNSVG